MKRLPLLALITFLPLAPAVQAAENNSVLLQTARTAGSYAGGARFCQVDEELLEEFIAKAEAKLRSLAQDDYEKVLGQLEFKNVLTAASAKEPVGGCHSFVPNFQAAVKENR